MQNATSKGIDEPLMLSESEAIKIASDYLKKERGFELALVKVFHIPGDSTEPMYAPFRGQPTWEIWFYPQGAAEWLPQEVIIYVDATTGEPWELNYGSPDDESVG